MANIRPFRFTGLPRYTREQVALVQNLSQQIGSRPFGDGFLKQLASTVGGALKTEVTMEAEAVRPITRSEVVPLLGEPCCVAVIEAAPADTRLLVSIDVQLASLAIETMLGGKGKGPPISRPLTSIEQGILSYPFLVGLEAFGSSMDGQLSLSLLRIASRSEDLAFAIDNEPQFHSIPLRISVGKRLGHGRVFIPESLIKSTFASPVPQNSKSPQEFEYMSKRLRALGDVLVLGRVEACHLDLNEEDIKSLEPGDIVVLDKHGLQRTEAGISGSATLRFGNNKNGYIQGNVVCTQGRVEFHVESLSVYEEPPEDNMADDEDSGLYEGEELDEISAVEEISQAESQVMAAAPPPAAENNLQETEGLLRNIDAPVAVELGRVKMNTAQVARLKQGQIIRLPRGPNDPVDIVVHGKIFARGELIEVDGELGVRLTELSGSK